MIPVENSIAGRVADIHHLLPESGLHIVGEYFMPIHFQLMALPGTSTDRIRTVRSHAHALGQCRRYLREHGWAGVVADDTAGAAREVAELGDPSVAALAPRLAAELYGLRDPRGGRRGRAPQHDALPAARPGAARARARRGTGHHHVRLPGAQRAGGALQGDGRLRDQRREHDEAGELPARWHVLRHPVLRRRGGAPEGRRHWRWRWRSSPSSPCTCASSAPTRPARSGPRSPSRRRTGPAPAPLALTRDRTSADYSPRAREPDTVRAWIRSGTRTRPARGSDRPSSPAATTSCRPSTSCSNGCREGGRSAASCSPACAASARRCCSTRCGRRRCGAGWGTGKLEARPDQPLRRPLAAALHLAVRELSSPRPGRGRAGARRPEVLRACARTRRPASHRRSSATAGSRASTSPAVPGRADSGDIEIDLVELLTDIGGLAAGRRPRRRDLRRRDAGPGAGGRQRALRGLPRDQPDRAAVRRRRRGSAAPAGGAVGEQVVLGAAVPVRPHRPARPVGGGPGAARAGGRRGRRLVRRMRWPRCTRRRRATRTSSRPTARPPGTSRRAPRSRRTTSRWRRPRRRRSSRSASSGRGSSGRRRRSASTCGRWPTSAPPRRTPSRMRCSRPPRWPTTSGRKPQSLSPARDGLIKKGLIYSGERGRIAFTVPHFGRYLRRHGGD